MATISADPRFQLARALLSLQGSENASSGEDDGGIGSVGGGGGPDAAIDIFATLLEESRVTFGETSLNAALCQYEYGNALFRAMVRRRQPDADDEAVKEDGIKMTAKTKSRTEVMATAALKRSNLSGQSNPSSAKKVKINDTSLDTESCPKGADTVYKSDNLGGQPRLTNQDNTCTDENEEEDDAALALDMMETSFSILMDHASGEDRSTKKGKMQLGKQWALGQLPRVLVCIGDLYSFRGEFGNAVDAYCRALPYREEAWNCLKQSQVGDKRELMTVEGLQCQRLLAENNALIAEAILESPKGENVVCHNYDDDGRKGKKSRLTAKGSNEIEASEKNKGKVLVPAKERLNFAESHYEVAREGVEDIIYRLGKMSAAKIELGNEKKDVGYLVMMVVGVGNTLKKEQTTLEGC